MSELAKREPRQVGTAKVRILLYSDDKNVREKVRFSVGPAILGREVDWVETATQAATLAHADNTHLDLMILDGEAAKSGGMGICRQLKHEIYDCPPVLLLVGRKDDAWLATWSEADAAVAHPLDPFAVQEAVEAFFTPAQATP